MSVYSLTCNGGNYQKWLRLGQTLKDLATSFVLDSNGLGNVYTGGPNGGSYQNWIFSGQLIQDVATSMYLGTDSTGKIFTTASSSIILTSDYYRWNIYYN